MAAVAKYRIKQTPTDVWSTRERLCLASSVLRSGDQNWVSVSRAIRPFGEANRPPDWFSQKNCALQYSDLLENVETPKRKRGERGEMDTPGDLIVRKLTIERIDELKKIIEEEQQKHKRLKKEIEDIKTGQLDNKLDELWKKIQEEMKAKEAMELEHQAWLRERESKIAAMKAIPKMGGPHLLGVNKPRRTSRQPPKSGEIRRSSSQSELSEQESTLDSPLSETLSLEVEDASSPLPAAPQSDVSQPSTPKQVPCSLSAAVTISMPTTHTTTPPSTSPLLTSLLRSPTPATPASPNFGAIMSTPVTQPKEGLTPSTPPPRPCTSTPQSFFNPSSALATAAARQLAVATVSSPSSSSPTAAASLFSPTKDLSSQMVAARSPIHGAPPTVPSHSPISSAPTLTKLLEMPLSLPGKLPPLPVMSSLADTSEGPSKTCLPVLATTTAVASLSSDTNVVDTVATKAIPAVVIPIASGDDTPSSREPDTPSLLLSSPLASCGTQEGSSILMLKEEPTNEGAALPESCEGEVLKEAASEMVDITQKEAKLELDEEHKTILELMDIVEEMEVGHDTEVVPHEHNVIVVKKEVQEAHVEVKEEIIEAPEVIETEIISEVILVDDILDSVSAVKSSEELSDAQVVEVKDEVFEESQATDDAPLRVVSRLLAISQSSSDTTGPSMSVVEAGPSTDVAAALPVNEEETKKVSEELEDKVFPARVSSEAGGDVQTVDGIAPLYGDDIDRADKADVEDVSTPPLTQGKRGQGPQEREKQEHEVRRGRGRPKLSRDQGELLSSTVDEMASTSVPCEAEAVSHQDEVIEEFSTNNGSEMTGSNAPVELSRSPVRTNADILPSSEGIDIEVETLLTDKMADTMLAVSTTIPTSPGEETPPPKSVAKDEETDDSNITSVAIEASGVSGSMSLECDSVPDEKEADLAEEEIERPPPETYKRPKAGGKQGTTREDIAQMHEIKEDSLSGDKIQTPSSVTGDSIPNSPASVSQSEDQESIRDYKVWKKAIMLVWRAAATHKYANVFLHPVTNDVAPGYHNIVYRPMDLSTIKKNIETGAIKTTLEFQRDMMLMFQNAIMYNSSDHDVFHMAIEMQKEVMEHIQDFLATQLMVQTNESKSLRIRERERKNEGEKEEDKRKRNSSFVDTETRGKKRRSRADD